MTKMAFWNNGDVRVVRAGRLDRVSGRFIGHRPDPDIGLYAYKESGPLPGKYERSGPLSHTNDGWTITATRSVVSMSVDVVRERRKREVRQKRDAVRDAGIDWSPDGGVTVYWVQTDGDSRRELVGAVVGLNETGGASQAWRMGSNALVVLGASDFKAMATAVRDHVNACYVRQAELESVLGASPDPAAEDIDSGWPAVHTEPA